MRRAIRAILRVILRIFFPRIELSGRDRVPADGPVMFAVNHPNGLIDPLFLICLSPRPVSFLAKAPLFDMPVIGWFVRVLGSIPVYRRQDGAFDPRQNLKTFERARAILNTGGAIAIFPEGASHGDPKLRPIKSGAARIALGATAVAEGEQSLTIAPVGIYYTAKGIFRSGALLYFGEPITLARTSLGAEGEPSPDEVRNLTRRIEQALSNVTLQADEHEALTLVARAEQVLSSDEPAGTDRLVDQFELRRRILAGYSKLRDMAPERVASVSARIARYESELGKAGIDPQTLLPHDLPPAQLMRELVKAVAFFLILMPPALVGAVAHYPAYRLVGFIATGLSRGDDDIVATIKILAGALLFPLTWIAIAVAVGLRYGTVAAIAVLLVAPLTGYTALRFFERLDEFAGGVRAVFLSRFRRWGYLQLVAERSAIRKEIVELGAEFE
jgi:glycerol-3-phosphate O-acyltransferase/dihydroxyacetone phosphate acyltransferase